MFYTVNDLKHDWKHDRLALLAVFGTVTLFCWLIIPSWVIRVTYRKLVTTYRRYGKEWFILTITNFIASGVAISIWLPIVLKWTNAWCD